MNCRENREKKNYPPPPPPPQGVAVGILGSQKIKSLGNVTNCPENLLIFFYPSHPGGGSGGGGGGDQNFNQKSGKFHELSRKSIKHFFTPPLTKGGRSGNFSGSKNQKSGKCHELPRKVITKNLPHPTGGWEFYG